MIIRGPRPERYTILRREMLNDDRLSFRALGVLSFVLDKPDDWRIDADKLARSHQEGRDAVRAALVELEETGYLVRTKYRDANGRWAAHSVIHEVPHRDGKPATVDQRRETSDGFPGGNTNTGTNTDTEVDAHFVRVASAAERDALYAAVCRACGMSYDEMTPVERKRTGVAVSNLLKVGATPEQVEQRADIYLQRNSSSLTPSALAGQWSRLRDDAPVAKAPVRETAADRAIAEFMAERDANVVPIKRSGS